MINHHTAQPTECRDRIQCGLSSETGVLRFQTFTIVEGPECAGLSRLLREYLVGRPLAEVDLDCLQNLKCQGNGDCVSTVVDMIREYQDLFVGSP